MAKEIEKKKKVKKPSPEKKKVQKRSFAKDGVEKEVKPKKIASPQKSAAKKTKEKLLPISSLPEIKAVTDEKKTTKPARPVKSESPLKTAKKTKKQAAPLHSEEIEIEALKYFTPEKKHEKAYTPSGPANFSERDEFEIENRYEDNKVVLMARDPHWCYVYWDISDAFFKSKTEETSRSGEKFSLIIRLYDITNVVFDGQNSHRFLDINVSGEASNWYVNVWAAGRTYLADLGYKTESGKFILIARSNTACTPVDSVSENSGEGWPDADEDFEGLFRASGGGKTSGSGSENFMSPLEFNLSSGNVSSFSSPGEWAGGPFQNQGKKRKFFLIADTELILYGATEPDAVLRVKGEIIKLNQDGTFSMRFHLPNGVMELPVEAESSDGVDKQSINFTVEKKTK